MFGAIERVHQMLNKNEYEREFFTLSDGGVIGFDWYLCPEDKQPSGQQNLKKKDLCKENSGRPLLAVIPGVTGDNTKLYMISLVKAACKNGFDLVCINYRGMAGVPLKVYYETLTIISVDIENLSCG